MLKRSLKFLLKYFLFPVIFICCWVVPSNGQDIKEMERIFSYSDDVYSPQIIMNIPKHPKGLVIYDYSVDLNPSFVKHFEGITYLELNYISQNDLLKQFELVTKFPKIKYLAINYLERKGNNPFLDVIKLPEILSSLHNLEVLKFDGRINIDLNHGFELIKNLPNLKYLFLNNFLERIPESIAEFTELRGISLKTNKFSTLPNEFLKFDKLESIALQIFEIKDGKQFTNYYEVLTTLQKLPNLKSISIINFNTNLGDFNQLHFPQLNSLLLNSIDINGNQNIIDFLTKHTRLKSLHLQPVNLTVLDNRFENLTQLKEFTIIGRKQPLEINFDLSKLKHLKRLQLSSIKLIPYQGKFPRNLSTLTYFDADLTVLPFTNQNLKNIEYLDLSRNKLSSIDNPLGTLKKLKNLEKLNISQGILKELPDSIDKLKKLKHLDISNNELVEFPKSISNVLNLKSLIAQNNKIQRLPHDIGRLQNLELLNFEKNNIKSIPPSIGSLNKLKSLNLNNNSLDSLPAEIAHLSSLEVLELKNHNFNNNNQNDIKNFPVDLRNWKSIQQIELDNNVNINSHQVFKGLFTIPNNNFSVECNNCNVSELPETGWENFLGSALHLYNNKIAKIPQNIINARYLNTINLAQNNLPLKPIDLNQYAADQMAKLFWFEDLGFIKWEAIPKNDSTAKVLLLKSKDHYAKKEYLKSIEKFELALNINPNLNNLLYNPLDIGISYFHIGRYLEAISYLSEGYKREEAKNPNYISFPAEALYYRAKSFMLLRDTVKAIADLRSITEKYDERWAELVLLYKKNGQHEEAEKVYEAGLKSYKPYTEESFKFLIAKHFYLLELVIVQEDYKKLNELLLSFETIHENTPFDKKLISSIFHKRSILIYKIILEIINETYTEDKKRLTLETYNSLPKASGYFGQELLENWLSFTKLHPDKVNQIRDFLNSIKLHGF